MQNTAETPIFQSCIFNYTMVSENEVEGTMGQYDLKNGGAIYLVEDEQDVAELQVHHPERVAFVTRRFSEL